VVVLFTLLTSPSLPNPSITKSSNKEEGEKKKGVAIPL